MVLEIVFTLVIIIALLLFFGISPEAIFVILATVILGLIAVAMVLVALFFFLTDISLLFRRRVDGEFLHVDDSGRFDHAVYRAEGKEYSCLFPAESFGRARIYHKGERYFLLIPRDPKRRNAYDRHSLFTIAIGTFFSVIFVVMLVLAYVYIRFEM